MVECNVNIYQIRGISHGWEISYIFSRTFFIVSLQILQKSSWLNSQVLLQFFADIHRTGYKLTPLGQNLSYNGKN